MLIMANESVINVPIDEENNKNEINNGKLSLVEHAYFDTLCYNSIRLYTYFEITIYYKIYVHVCFFCLQQ